MSELQLMRHRTLDPTLETKCFEYQMWDSKRRLVYVGIADDFKRRWTQHERASWWLGEVELSYVGVTGWPTRVAARFSEACVINEQSPVYNTAREMSSYRQSQIDVWPSPVERFVYRTVSA